MTDKDFDRLVHYPEKNEPQGIARLMVPLWCIMWIEIWSFAAYYLCAVTPDVTGASLLDFGNPLTIARGVGLFVAIMIAAMCIAHKHIESWVVWLAPQVQDMVKDHREDYLKEEDEE